MSFMNSSKQKCRAQKRLTRELRLRLSRAIDGLRPLWQPTRGLRLRLSRAIDGLRPLWQLGFFESLFCTDGDGPSITDRCWVCGRWSAVVPKLDLM